MSTGNPTQGAFRTRTTVGGEIHSAPSRSPVTAPDGLEDDEKGKGVPVDDVSLLSPLVSLLPVD